MFKKNTLIVLGRYLDYPLKAQFRFMWEIEENIFLESFYCWFLFRKFSSRFVSYVKKMGNNGVGWRWRHVLCQVYWRYLSKMLMTAIVPIVKLRALWSINYPSSWCIVGGREVTTRFSTLHTKTTGTCRPSLDCA